MLNSPGRRRLHRPVSTFTYSSLSLAATHYDARVQHFIDSTAISLWQVVVMCRCFSDHKPAQTACHGIEMLASLMNPSKSNAIRTLVSNYIACLSHTRPGSTHHRSLFYQHNYSLGL